MLIRLGSVRHATRGLPSGTVNEGGFVPRVG